MDELTRWVDHDPARRRYRIERTGPLWGHQFNVTVWDTDSDDNSLIDGHGSRATLTFAAVEAILDYEKNLKAGSE